MTTLTLILTLRPSPVTMLTLTLTDPRGTFESFCVDIFVTLYGTIPALSTVQ